VPHTLDLIVQRRLAPGGSLAADRALLDEVRAPTGARTGALRVYDLAGEVLSLGRFHLAPEDLPASGVQLWRRRSGGRAMPWGEGFVGLSLVLPHRSALVASDPLALRPEQVLNRHVRGILEACELSGVPAFYPGRDVVTVDGRLLGLVSFEVDPTGAFLFEAVVANTRDASVLPALLDRADPGGVVKAGMLTADDTTSLARALGRELGTEEVAERLCRGYERRLGVRFEERVLPTDAPADDAGWLAARRPRADLDRHGSVATQLGVCEAHFALDGDRIRDLVLAGDFIANSSAIERLERELRGCAAELAAIDAVVERVFAAPESFVLGIGPRRTIAETIVRGLA
jgi:lipoate-protein ligase A